MPARLSSMDVLDENTANGDSALDGNTADRRRSGRVVKKPELYAPTAQRAQDAGRGKRKRGKPAGDEENEDTGLDHSGHTSEEGSDDATEGEADDEELKQKSRRTNLAKKKRKQPLTKKTKTATRTSTLPLRTMTKKPQPKTRKPGQADRGAAGAAHDLYAELFSSRQPVEATATEWISRYEQSNAGAIKELVNLVLRASGCDLEITIDDVEDQDNVTGKVADLQDEYQAQNVTQYPLISRAKSKHPFRATLVDFFTALITTANTTSILYTDLALIENIQLWLTTMSSSAIRPFRHTATVISLTILSALCDVAVEVTEGLATTRRQLDGEKKKKGRVNAGRVTALEKKIVESNQKYEAVETVIRDIFETVFIHRYRDVDPRIRVECVQALGYWIYILPDVFFDGSYLRYLGWVLTDTHAPTRLEVVKQLQKLYKKKGSISGLAAFTERFRSRLVEMATRDADPSVRASTVELLDLIRAMGLLEPEDIDQVGKLIFDSEARVRQSVINFFVENVNDLFESKVEGCGGGEALEEIIGRETSDSFDSPNTAWLKLECLAEVLQSYDTDDVDGSLDHVNHGPIEAGDLLVAKGEESRFSLAAQAFYERIPEVRNWEGLATYLLFDHSGTESVPSTRQDSTVEDALKAACKLSEKEEITLLEVLNASVRTSLAQSEAADNTKKGKKPKNAKVASSEDQENTALRLAHLIPKLLNKFGATPTTASAVLRLEHVLDLEVFQQLREDSTTYAALLDDINKQFVSHNSQSVLAEASAALLHARCFEDLQEVTDAKLQRLWEDLTSTLYALVNDRPSDSRTNVPLGALTELTNNVRRISNLASVSDCVGPLEQWPSSTGSGQEKANENSSPLQTLLESVDRGAFNNDQPLDDDVKSTENELTMSAMSSILFYFMWKLRSLQGTVADGHEVADASIEHIGEYRDQFALKLLRIMEYRSGADKLRQLATGVFLDLHILFATSRQNTKELSQGKGTATGSVHRLQSLASVITDEQQTLVASVYTASERAYAKKAGRKIEVAEDDDPVDDDLESDSEEEGDGEGTAREHQKMKLLYEQQLCELAGKIVLAIVAEVLDASGRRRGKMKERLLRNRARLGPNFKEVVAYLDEPKAKKTKKQLQDSESKRVKPVSEPTVAEEDREDAEVEDQEVEEGGEEDLRNRELVLDDEVEDEGGEKDPEDDTGALEDNAHGD